MMEKFQVNNVKLSFVGLVFVVLGLITVRVGSQVISDDTNSPCPDTWISVGRRCYKFSSVERSWGKAQDECKAEDGELTMMQNGNDKSSLRSYLTEHFSKKHWWVGLRKTGTGSIITNDRQRRNSTPKVVLSEDECGFVDTMLGSFFANCSENKLYICEYRNTSTPRSSFEHSTSPRSAENRKVEEILATTAKPARERPGSSAKPRGDIRPEDSEGSPTNDIKPKETTTTRNLKGSISSTTKPAKPKQPPSTSPTSIRQVTTHQNGVSWDTALEEFKGCFIPGTGESLKELAMSAMRFYKNRSACPAVKIGSSSWPVTKNGENATSHCSNGIGVAEFVCAGEERVCWRGQPDITGCANKKLQAILKKIKISGTDEENLTLLSVEELVTLSSQLVNVTATAVSTMEDVIVTSHILTALTKDKEMLGGSHEGFQDVVKNVIEAGNNLISRNKSAMWKEMSQNDRVRSASSLLIALETATLSAARKFDHPTVITRKNEHFELELQVVDLDELEREKKTEILYSSEQSQNTFSIPLETLRSSSKGHLARAVFITHLSLANLLGRRKITSKTSNHLDVDSDQNVTSDTVTEEKEEEEENTKDDKDQEDEKGPKLISYILSASLGGENSKTKLPKPISFTIEHLEELDANSVPLCSFWNVSQGSQFGFWSQNGCRLVRGNRSHTMCECDHMTNFAILLDVHGVEMTMIHKSLLRFVSIIGCVVSIVCLLASWLTFQCFASLQGERNSIHKNLAATLLVAEILFVFGIDQAQHQVLCSAIAAFLHYFFLAAFTWMFIEGLHIIFMLVQVFAASRSRLPGYYFVGYGFPLVVVLISCLVYKDGYGTAHYCWLTTEKHFVWAFAGPVAIILATNAIFLAHGMITVCKHSPYVFNSKGKTGSGIRAWIQGAVALEVLLGLTWALGYFMINDESGSVALAYIFSILNSLQGLFIFIYYCLLNKKAQKGYRSVARAVVTRTTSGGRSTSRSSQTKRPSHSIKLEDTHTSDKQELDQSHIKILPRTSSAHNVD